MYMSETLRDKTKQGREGKKERTVSSIGWSEDSPLIIFKVTD